MSSLEGQRLPEASVPDLQREIQRLVRRGLSGALALIAVQGTARARAGPPAVKVGPGSQRAASAGGRHGISLCTPPAARSSQPQKGLRIPSFAARLQRTVFLVSEVPLDLILERLHLTSIYFTTVLCSKDQLRTAETRAHQPVLSHRHRRRAEAQRDERKAQCNGCKRLLKPPTAEQELSAMGMSSAEISKLGKELLEQYGPDPQ